MQSNNNSGQTNPNWSFTFSGMDQVQTSSATIIPAEGYYEAILVSNVASTEREGTVEFTCRIVGGEFDGCQVSKGIKLPSHANNAFVWKGLFESLGYADNDINAPQFNPNPADWNGMPCTIYWRAGNKELSIYRELRFYKKSVWASKKSRFEAQKSSTGSTASAAPVSKPSIPSAPQANVVPNAGNGLQGSMSGVSLMNRLRNN